MENEKQVKTVEIPENAHVQSIVHESDGHIVKDPEASLNNDED